MEIQYRYQIEDFEAITAAAYRMNPRADRTRKAYLLIGIAAVVLPFLAAASLLHPDWSLWPVVVFGAWLIYVGVQTPRRVARKQYADQIQQYDYKAIISEAGIITISPTVRTELSWQAFSRCIAAPSIVALVYEAVMYLFPRRAFNDQQWEEFCGLIRSHVPGAEV